LEKVVPFGRDIIFDMWLESYGEDASIAFADSVYLSKEVLVVELLDVSVFLLVQFQEVVEFNFVGRTGIDSL
jgi:hypothetical protein